MKKCIWEGNHFLVASLMPLNFFLSFNKLSHSYSLSFTFLQPILIAMFTAILNYKPLGFSLSISSLFQGLVRYLYIYLRCKPRRKNLTEIFISMVMGNLATNTTHNYFPCLSLLRPDFMTKLSHKGHIFVGPIQFLLVRFNTHASINNFVMCIHWEIGETKEEPGRFPKLGNYCR